MKKTKKDRFPLPENLNKVTAPCSLADECNACFYQDISYEDELKHKEFMVMSSLEKIESFPTWKDTFEKIHPATKQLGYRNKLEFSFGDDGPEGNLTLGLKKKNRYYEVLEASTCLLADEDFQKIMRSTQAFFAPTDKFVHPFREHGALKYLVVRKGFYTQEILINLVAASHVVGDIKEWSQLLLELPLQGKIVGIHHSVDNTTSGGIRAEKIDTYYGVSYYHEKLFDLTFQVSLFSFFQTNTKGAEKLYQTVKEYILPIAKDIKNPILFDLYCGTGTIGQILSSVVAEVYGIDIVSEAIDMANENAKSNLLDNCHFITGDVRKMLSQLPENPDIIVVDPPREGLHTKLLQPLLSMQPQAICYASCNPHTLAIDLPTLLEGGYHVDRFSAHDLFPKTRHVETVVLMTRK